MRPIEPVRPVRVEPPAPVRAARRVLERTPEDDEERRRHDEGRRREQGSAEEDGHVDVRA